MASENDSFLRLLDAAVALSRSRADGERFPWRREIYDTLARNLAKTAAQVRSGEWSSAPGAGLGATKFLSESGLDDDQIYDAVAAAEKHHIQFGCS